MQNHTQTNKSTVNKYANNKYNKQIQDNITNGLIYMDNPKR